MRSLELEEMNQVNGGHGNGQTAAAIAGFAVAGPVGAFGAALAYSAGYELGTYIYQKVN